MKKVEYLMEVERELKKYKTDEFDVLFDQAKGVVEVTEVDMLYNELGSPKKYVRELLKQNDIEPIKAYEDKTLKNRILGSSYDNDGETIKISVSMGKQEYKLKSCKKVILDATCARVFLDVSALENDIDLIIDAHFSEVNLILKKDTYIIDNSSILVGTNIFDLDNNIKTKDGIKITIEGKVVASAINTMEAP